MPLNILSSPHQSLPPRYLTSSLTESVILLGPDGPGLFHQIHHPCQHTADRGEKGERTGYAELNPSNHPSPTSQAMWTVLLL